MSEHELAELDDDGGEVLIPGPAPLTPREESFCRIFGDPESQFYGRPTKAAVAAGYAEKSAWNTAWKLRKRPAVQSRLAEFQKAATAAAGKVLADLENTRLLALERGDLSTAARCAELAGKHLGLFLENSVLTLNQSNLPRYDAHLAEQAAKITEILLRENPPLLEAPAALDGQESQAPRTRQESE